MSLFSTSNNNYTHLIHNPETRALYIFDKCVYRSLFSLSFDKHAYKYIYIYIYLRIQTFIYDHRILFMPIEKKNHLINYS